MGKGPFIRPHVRRCIWFGLGGGGDNNDPYKYSLTFTSLKYSLFTPDLLSKLSKTKNLYRGMTAPPASYACTYKV